MVCTCRPSTNGWESSTTSKVTKPKPLRISRNSWSCGRTPTRSFSRRFAKHALVLSGSETPTDTERVPQRRHLGRGRLPRVRARVDRLRMHDALVVAVRHPDQLRV